MVAEHDKRPDVGFRQPGQAVPEGELSPEASVRKIEHVSGDQQKIHRFFETQVYQPGKGIEGGGSQLSGRGRQFGSGSLERAAEMKIRGMDERKRFQNEAVASGSDSPWISYPVVLKTFLQTSDP